MMTAVQPQFAVEGSYSGEILLQYPPEDGLPPLVQSPKSQAVEGEAAARFLKDAHLTLQLAGAAGDVSIAGLQWRSSLAHPTLWTEPTEPRSLVEPLLPHGLALVDCDGAGDEGGDEEGGSQEGQERGPVVGFREVALTEQQGGPGLALARRPHARQGTREFVRGSMASMPFMPGGEAFVPAGNPAAAAAAAEASSGQWLRELEGGTLPPVAAPGLERGLFGGWALGEEAPAVGPSGGAAVEDGVLGRENGADTGAQNGRKGTQQQQQQQSKVSLDELFSGVWLLDEEEEETQGEEGEGEESPASMSEGRPAPAASQDASTTATAVAGEPSVVAQLLLLPEGGDLPGGVEEAGLELLGAGAGAGAPSWMRQPGKAQAPPRKRKGEYEWAIRGSIRNLEEEYAALRPTMAKTFPFELDTFQKEAVVHMEQGRSVFVAAHTSAGKTVVAEYAFALASKHCTRAVYTSPIKTISNQKFRDFGGQFEVGLLTGDVQIKTESSCLIMTTEILRSMLYKGADIIRDIEWVIFDEVHYVNDAERGVVWEEVIIMLPAHVNLVLLSATVPNVDEFADWVGRTKRKPIYVSATNRRPVPLQHNLYYGGKMYLVGQGDKNFNQQGFKDARAAHQKKNAVPQTKAEAKAQLPTGRGDGGRGPGRGDRGRGSGRAGSGGQRPQYRPPGVGGGGQGGGGGGAQLRSEKSQWMALIDELRKKDLVPAVVFCFSKKRCDALADNLQSLDLTSASEKSEIHVFCEKSLARLKGGDRELPQILRLREMLKRGLGVHHAGLLPIMKEVVEMLFCRGVIKILFSTETFAMGVNAPARTVVFQSLRKHDGKSFRTLLPGEYTQMAGRAGRRGLDAVGTVVIACWEDLPEESDIKRLLTGSATKLESQFRLTYSMILNLLRVEDLKVEDMLKRSFAEFHAQRGQPEQQEALRRGQEALRRLHARPWPQSPLSTSREAVEQYVDISLAIQALDDKLQDQVMATRAAQQALTNGRVVLVTDRASGLTEVGVVCAPEEGGGGGAGARRGVGLSAAPAAPSGDYSTAGGRKHTVLALHRPSPLDSVPGAAAGGAGAAAADVGQAGAGGGLLGGEAPLRQIGKRQDDDDMFLGLKALGGGRKKGGGDFGGSLGRGGFRPLALPHSGNVGGTSYRLAEMAAADITGICRVKIRVDAEEVLSEGGAASLAAAVNALVRVQGQAEGEGGDPPLMDPIADLKLNSLDLVGDVRERARLAALRASLPAHRDPGLPEMLAMVRSERLLQGRLQDLLRALSDANLAQLPEFHQRVKVLQQLGYLETDRTVALKGRVACEVNSGDELVATEIIFGGVLAELTPEEAVALLSALVFQEKTAVEPVLPPRLAQARDEAIQLALGAGQVQRECGLDIVPQDFVVDTLKFGLMEVVYEWAKGTPFQEICQLTDVMEGSIVRAIVRLDETCREFRDAARVMGNTALFQQMEAASAAIKRDVIFAASLYVA